MKKIILASASLRRRELLKKTGFIFSVHPSKIKESIKTELPPAYQAICLALAKAEKVAKKYRSGLVLALDTLVVHKGKIFGKPKGYAHAKKMLAALSNTTHAVYTAIAVIDAKTKKTLVDIDKTTIFSRRLSKRQIENLALKNHDKAGAYAVQENSDILIRNFRGDFNNIVGLPLSKVLKILKIFGIKTGT
ncbi:MAG: Maf family protein [Candidatus Omnitrophota bacterium]